MAQASVMSPAKLTDRFTDVPPWNGGDQIVRQIPGGVTYCTTGFGAHDSSGHEYMLTAGHCADNQTGNGYKWYNTRYTNPDFSNGRFVGYPDSNAGGIGIDVERIPTPSSDLFWMNANQRQYVANDTAPMVGQNVCLEGSITEGSCGEVTATNVSRNFDNGSTYNYLFYVTNGIAQPGDSGGPIVWPTIYGYIAVGTISGVTSQGGTTVIGIGTGIGNSEYIMGATVNSVVKPG